VEGEKMLLRGGSVNGHVLLGTCRQLQLIPRSRELLLPLVAILKAQRWKRKFCCAGSPWLTKRQDRLTLATAKFVESIEGIFEYFVS
jgi:hypothetical protein